MRNIFFLVLISIFSISCTKGEKVNSISFNHPGSAEAPELDNFALLKTLGDLEELPSLNLSTYRYLKNGCDTEYRVGLSKEQYCIKLQDSSINNRCALAERKTEFANSCTGMEWNPDRVVETRLKAKGAHANCFASDPNEDQTASVHQSGLFVNDEYFSNAINIMRYDHYYAVVLLSLKDGLFTVTIRTFNVETKKHLVSKTKTWKDQDPDSIMLEDLAKGVRVTCWPSIH